MTEYRMFVEGLGASDGPRMPVFNPATEELIAEVPVASGQDVQTALQAAKSAQPAWARLTGVDRGKILRRWGHLVEENKSRLARILSEEEGKPLAEAEGEIDFGASWFHYYAEFDRRIEGEIVPSDKPGEQIWIVPAPVGVVAGIIPWNYP